MARCLECRFHSKEKRRDVDGGVVDGDMEIVEWKDEPQDFLLCMVDRRGPKEVGFVHRTPEAGSTCPHFEQGKREKLQESAFAANVQAALSAAKPDRPVGGNRHASDIIDKVSLSDVTRELVDSLNDKERAVLDKFRATPTPEADRIAERALAQFRARYPKGE